MVKNLMAFFTALLRAIGFLTRLPIDKKYYQSRGENKSDAGLYPLAGLLIGCAGAGVLGLSEWVGLSPLVASLLATTCLISLTGGLHEDGLSDVTDAFFAPKAYDAAARLVIMKDSHIGVFGVLSLILTLGLRVVLLAELVGQTGIIVAAGTLMMAEAVSRAGMVALWPSLPNVSAHSIAHSIGAPRKADALKAAFIGFLILLLLSFFTTNFMLPVAIILFLGGILLMFRSLCRRKIGGICGDVLGAAQQIGVVSIFLTCALILK